MEIFIETFKRMEALLLQHTFHSSEWETAKKQCNIKNNNRVVKKFIDYATSQGSQCSYIMNKYEAFAALKILQKKYPELSSIFDKLELNQLITCEIIAERSLLKWIDKKQHYNSVLRLTAQDIENYAKAIR